MNRPIAAATVPTGCPVWLGRCTADRTDAAAAHFGFFPHALIAALEDRLRRIRDPRDQEARLDPRRRGRAPTLAVASLHNPKGGPRVPRAPVRPATIPPNAGDNPREVLERRLVTTAHDRRVQPPLASSFTYVRPSALAPPFAPARGTLLGAYRPPTGPCRPYGPSSRTGTSRRRPVPSGRYTVTLGCPHQLGCRSTRKGSQVGERHRWRPGSRYRGVTRPQTAQG